MGRLRLSICLIFLCFILTGCASLFRAISDVTPEQANQMQSQIATTAGPFIPAPYQLPATALAGWIACIAYNWFKEKTKLKV